MDRYTEDKLKSPENSAVTRLLQKTAELDIELETQARRAQDISRKNNEDMGDETNDFADWSKFQTPRRKNRMSASFQTILASRAQQQKTGSKKQTLLVNGTTVANEEEDEDEINTASSSKQSRKSDVYDATQNYSKATALLERLMGKSKLQQSAIDGQDHENHSTSGSTFNHVSTISASVTTNGTASKKKKKKKTLLSNTSAWPYDDYGTLMDTPSVSNIISSATLDNQNDDETQWVTISDQSTAAYQSPTTSTSNENFERPAELPSIQVAVRHLPLADFEAAAQQRAIGIISTWIYDSGLVDELLVVGSMPGSINKNDKSSENDDRTNIESDYKMEREIDRLRRTTEQELAFVNTRLNDGVNTSGQEVQELVKAVSETKGEISHLRRMLTYVSKHGENNGHLLANYPHLRASIHARKNFYKVFRELNFFSQIGSTCTRLRNELHSREWTDQEYATIRNVSMEHVELEVLLVQAEVRLKSKLGITGEGVEATTRGVKGQDPSSANERESAVDEYLEGHVKNVWSLGEEIRMRILAGIESAFELALENPAGLVALVEAVEVYERAAEQYKKNNSMDHLPSGKLRFTDMRAAALNQLYQDFEVRGLEVFRNIHMQAADTTENEEDAANAQFTSVLMGATELIAQMDVVKHELAPCFAPTWSIEILWSSCIAHVCSNQILQQIGGPEGHRLADFSIAQLLKLVGWVEYFRDQTFKAFPEVSKLETTKKTYLDTRPELFSGKQNQVDMDAAADSIAWANNMLWEVHRLAQDEFLLRVRNQSDEFLGNSYTAEHSTYQSGDGKVTTSLCEDVFSLIGMQVRTLQAELTKGSDAFIMAVCLVFMQLRSKQMHSRDYFIKDLESACAAANDFIRMGEKCEEMMEDIKQDSEFPISSSTAIDECLNEVVTLYSNDAVYAAQCVHNYVFEEISEALYENFFNAEWETELTFNQHAQTLVKTLEDFMEDLVKYLDELVYWKVIDALVTSTVIFYIEVLLSTADTYKGDKEPYFQNPAIALDRIKGDIQIFKEFFKKMGGEMPTLHKTIKKDLSLLQSVFQLLQLAAGVIKMDVTDAVLAFHIHVQDQELTRRAVADIWHLMNPSKERKIWDFLDRGFLEGPIQATKELRRAALERSNVPGLLVSVSLAKLYKNATRTTPAPAYTMERIQRSLQEWEIPDHW